MTTHLSFLLLGLGAGAVYALLGIGLVLEYRISSVINFAHGAIAMFVAYVYAELRRSGDLLLPVVGLPHRVSLGGHWPAAAAVAAALAYAAAMGLAIQTLVFRPLRSSTPLTKLVASVGLMVVLQAIIVLNLGSDAFGFSGTQLPSVLPSGTIAVGDVRIAVDRLWLAGIAVAIGLLLWAVFRWTRFGLVSRAVADDEMGAITVGHAPGAVGAVNWMIASALAGLSGILIAPISGLDPATVPYLVVPAIAVALIGRLTSFAVALVAGLGLGMLQSDIVQLQLDFSWLPDHGLQEGLPLVLIAAAFAVHGRSIPLRGEAREAQLPSTGAAPLRAMIPVAAAIGVAALFVLGPQLRLGLISSVTLLPVCLSLTLLSGYAGQASLAQMACAGVGAFATALASHEAGVPFPVSFLVGAVAAVPLGLVVGAFALRGRGVQLAIVSLALAVAVDALVFRDPGLAGGLQGRQVDPPSLYGRSLDVRSSNPAEFPRPAFGVMAITLVALLCLAVANLRRSATGRQMLAIRANERAAVALGVPVVRVKVTAYALSAFIAGIGGALIASQAGFVTASTFSIASSLTALTIVYTGGLARISGAVAAAVLLAPGGLGATFLERTLGIGHYMILLAGLGPILVMRQQPSGFTHVAGAQLRAAARQFRHRSPVATDVAEVPAV